MSLGEVGKLPVCVVHPTKAVVMAADATAAKPSRIELVSIILTK